MSYKATHDYKLHSVSKMPPHSGRYNFILPAHIFIKYEKKRHDSRNLSHHKTHIITVF